ncbi:formate dehydrogenase accessory sulfurtransferase FdhD [uncultured Paraglaciecola sp.]|uniref:formate dehydrogenase accessory sulfurtransferase FdhD n=1 Tax=uncultured Paraglaciecola sp. TaxID=1765024 RepID=UPI00261B8FCC|nr:formate dehydrogenase accessory sulfurtransferase FdhD [uncultured Paraglaciecola sp.]
MPATKQFSITKVIQSTNSDAQSNPFERDDCVVTEEPLEIWLSAYPSASLTLLFTTMRTPGDDLNLVRGWLLSSGAIQNGSNILSIKHTGTGRLKEQPTNRVQVHLAVDANVDLTAYQRVEVMNSACGVCGQQSIENILDKRSQPVITYSQTSLLPITAIHSLTQQLRYKQIIFNQTGGTHGAGLFDQSWQLLDVREDIGRHNALDKLIGANEHLLAVENCPDNLVLGVVLSSRASFELVQKAAMANLGFIIALGAPSSLAIELAKDCDICLIGFVKSSDDITEFNVYSSTHRVA